MLSKNRGVEIPGREVRSVEKHGVPEKHVLSFYRQFNMSLCSAVLKCNIHYLLGIKTFIVFNNENIHYLQ